jgi:oligosaccharide repeat unit polymerase
VAATLTALVVISRARFRDWLYPPVLQAGLWAVLSFWFWLVQGSLYGIGIRTWWVIVLGALSFSVGAWLTTWRHTPVQIRNSLARGSLPSPLAERILLAVSLCFLAAFLRVASSVMNPTAYLSFISDVRAAHLDETVFGRLYIGLWWTLTYLGVCVLHVFDDPQRPRRWLLLSLATVLAIIYAVPMGGRQFFLFILIILCAPPLLLRRASPWKVAAVFAVVVIVIFVSISFLAGHLDLSVSHASLGDASIVKDVAYIYMLGPMVTFDSLVPEPTHRFGMRTFRVLYLWLQRLGWNIEVEPLLQPFTAISSQWETNIYTLYYYVYLDFGFAGILLYQLALGCWHGMLYRRATLPRPKAVWVMLYVIFLFPLIMQSAVDVYLSCLSNWINFGIIFALTFRLFGPPVAERIKAVQ